MSASHFVFIGIALIVTIAPPIRCGTFKPLNGRKVVLMSMDGFRYDYLTKTDTPNFDALIASGVKVPYVNNTFATWTFPCHYTIATGVYEENHGIVANRMYDPLFNSTFTKTNHEGRWWDGAEPIWINTVKHRLKTGIYFWPGSEAGFHGYRPTISMAYNKTVPFKERVDTVVSQWLSKNDFDFGIIYFHEPDKTGHMHGPDSAEMVETIKRMDEILGYFMQKLTDENLKEKVDLVLTSDHGMTSIDEHNRLVVLEDYVDSSLLKDVVISGAVAHLRPQPGKARELANALQDIDHISVYVKEDIPDHFHYKYHRRVMPVVAIADEGWIIRRNKKSLEYENGDHGYSNERMNMKPIFMATGPSFKQGVVADPIKSVDIYPLLCHILNIPPAPNNGSLDRVVDLLEGKGSKSTSITASFYVTVLMVLFSLSLQYSPIFLDLLAQRTKQY